MRAKCRRLKAEHGLALIVVDYLQLVSVGGPHREPAAGAVGDQPLDEGAREGARLPGHRAVAALARARGAHRQAPAAVGPSRVRHGRHARGAGRRTARPDPRARRHDARGRGAVDDGGRSVARAATRSGSSAAGRCSTCGWRAAVASAPPRSTACSAQRLEASRGAAGGDRDRARRRIPSRRPGRWPDDRLVAARPSGRRRQLPRPPAAALHHRVGGEQSSCHRGGARASSGATVNRHEGRGAWHQLVISGNGNRWHPAGVGLWLRELGIFGSARTRSGCRADVFALANDQRGAPAAAPLGDGRDDLPSQAGRRGSAARQLLDQQPRPGARTSRRSCCASASSRGIHTVHAEATHRPVPRRGVSGAEAQRRFLRRDRGVRAAGRAGRRRWQRLSRHVEPNPNVDTLPLEVFAEVRVR